MLRWRDALFDPLPSYPDDRQTVNVMVTIDACNMVSRFLFASKMGH